MQIIHGILGKADPERMNGVNKVVHHLAINQSANGGEVQIWGITPSPEKKPKVERNFPTRLFKKSKLRFTLPSSLKKAVASLDPANTLFHFHGGFIPEFWAWSRLLKAHGIRYIVTAHGSYNAIAMQRSKLRKDVYFKLFESALLANASAIHCIGNSEVLATRMMVPGAQLELIPNGTIPLDTVTRHLEPFEPVFGFIGRLDRYTKGLDLLVAAFAEHVKAGRRGKLWFIGDGGDRELVETHVRSLGLESRCVFYGSKYGEDKLRLLGNMDAFFHPSRNEGMPTAVLEAAAMGIPVVVSEETNTAAYVRKHQAGIAMHENSVEALTMAMHQICRWKQDPEFFEQLRENARTMRHEEFDWQIIARKMIEVYKHHAA